MGAAPSVRTGRRPVAHRRLAVGVALLAVGAVASVFLGVADVTPASLLADDGHARDLLLLSRLPRTAAILLAGSAAAVAGVVLQLLVRNRFVEPSTVGTTESAQLGLLAVTVLAPAMPLPGKLAVAAATAVLGTLLFLAVLRAVPVRSGVTVPLVGLMLGGVIGAVTAFFAFQLDLLQTLGAWTTGDFSGVIAGRFELLWLVGALAVAVYLVADRFTVVGLGRDVATSLGLGYRGMLALGLGVVAVTSAVVVVVVGGLPFLGLVVPNVVSLLLGDNLRRTLPWVAVGGAGLVLVADVVARLVVFPFEVPIGAVMAVVGGALFLWILLRRGTCAG
ncbi:ABC transporter permease [Xylanimonas protaetiae]|uniref:ABC transporter permease n=1 Tax=Xylanimonas protaetiae TaxID=2509457 RepID=A0A4P6FE30_9MICO|nr:ABC transporter permease [Xylanimonas protaetiae]